ncbi:MAG TPA: tryptophan--tRNA ligase [Anaerolineaceae bacterium]|nr:tryptophan--tRNA ligase [Anaerolineaceae bacterium]
MPNPTPPTNGDETESLKRCIKRSSHLWDEMQKQPSQFRVLTGERTTGALHIGHYFSSLKSRVKLQGWSVEMFLILADYQAITDRKSTESLKSSIKDIILDYLAVGIDPQKATIFCHSMVPSLNQLLLPFLSVVSMSELQRNPTVKDEIALLGTRSVSGLMMTYPVHQAADILYCKGNVVPGGKDQLPHVELTRSIARRINNDYFHGEPFFPEPELLLGDGPILLGLDGRKMGKSLNNSIQIKMSADETAQLIKKAKTDSNKTITYDPVQRPEVANLLMMYSLCTGADPAAIANQIGSQGSSVLKKELTEVINDYFQPMRERRKRYEQDGSFVWEILKQGNIKANQIADKTLNDLRAAMHMQYY